MKARPILFSGPMVRALLAGSKTQTRRIVKGDKPGQPLDWLDAAGFDPAFVADRDNGLCPYGYPGDCLWVRETCRAEEMSRPQQTRPATRRERQNMGRTTVIELDELDGADGVRYLADDDWHQIENTPQAGEAWSALFHYRDHVKGRLGNQVPSIHMPRWASRLTLEITEVRVERLRDISDDDCKAEGIGEPYFGDGDPPFIEPGVLVSRWMQYRNLWMHLNGKESWAANPFVWAISSKVHHQNVDALLTSRAA